MAIFITIWHLQQIKHTKHCLTGSEMDTSIDQWQFSNLDMNKLSITRAMMEQLEMPFSQCHTELSLYCRMQAVMSSRPCDRLWQVPQSVPNYMKSMRVIIHRINWLYADEFQSGVCLPLAKTQLKNMQLKTYWDNSVSLVVVSLIFFISPNVKVILCPSRETMKC